MIRPCNILPQLRLAFLNKVYNVLNLALTQVHNLGHRMPVPIIGIHLQLDYIVAWQVLQVLFLAVVVDAQDAEGKDAVFGDQLG